MEDSTWVNEEHIKFITLKAGETLSGIPALALGNVRPTTPTDDRPRGYLVIIIVKTRHVVIANVTFPTFSNLFGSGDLAGAEKFVREAILGALAGDAA
jgi:hypothetical protein